MPIDWLRALGLKRGDSLEMIYNSVVLLKRPGRKLDLEMLRRELEELRP